MQAPWNKHEYRASPRQWLIRRLAGSMTVVLNAHLATHVAGDEVRVVLRNGDANTLIHRSGYFDVERVAP